MVYVAPSVYYTEPSRGFMGQLLDLAPGSQNGGIYANKPGYHNTRDQNSPDNYSVVLPPDKKGPRNKAAGYDWTFPEAQQNPADYSRISLYSNRLFKAGQANDPRTNGWREFYGQADLDLQVEGYDFYYNRPAGSDISHLWHIHFSELREFLDNDANKDAMLSILRGETLEQWYASQGKGVEDDDMWMTVEPGGTVFLFDGTFANGKLNTWFPVWGQVEEWRKAGVRYVTAPANLNRSYYNLHAPGELPVECEGGSGGLVPHTHDIPAGNTGSADPSP